MQVIYSALCPLTCNSTGGGVGIAYFNMATRGVAGGKCDG